MKRIISEALLVLLLIGTFAFAFHAKSVLAQAETIYINADGSISPSDASISTVDNETYTLTGNINDSITVQRSNIIICGNGYTLTPASGNNCAFNLTTVDNVTITNATLATLPYSVTSYDQNIPGFLLVNTNDSEIISNTIAGNFMDNPYSYAISLTSCFDDNVSSNRVTGTTNGIALFSSGNNVVFNNHFEQEAFDGIGLYSSDNNTLNGNYVSGCALLGRVGAFELESSDNNTLVRNDITGNGQGIQLEGSDNNVLIENNMTQNEGNNYGDYPTFGFGINIESSSNNHISQQLHRERWLSI